jgi:uncharacterized phiE125 gp8 family phage protein
MHLRTITAPTVEPVTLAELRAQARIDAADDDAALAGYLLAARQWVERITGRAFAVQTLELILDDFPAGGTIYLPRVPVASITSISYLDAAGATQTVASHILEGESGRLQPAYGESWPSARGTPGSVLVRFVAGIGQAPNPVKQAILLLAAQWNEYREAPPENPAVDALLSAYKTHWF